MLLSFALVAGLVTAPAPVPVPHEYVALGDSWSADVSVTHVTTAYVPSGCAQSTYDYPHQVSAALGIRAFRDATCGGATTRDMTGKQDVTRVPHLFDGVNAPQFDRLTTTTDLVTLGIGGNDAGLAAAVGKCISLLPRATLIPGVTMPAPFGAPCKDKWVSGGVDRMSAAIAATGPRVAAAVDGIRQRSPRARILLVNYLAGIRESGGGCYPYVPITDQDMTWLGQKLRELNAMLAGVAANRRVELVDTYSGSRGHDVCRAPGTKWVEGLLPLTTDPLGPAIPFHPNKLGANYQARAVLATVNAGTPRSRV
ncbi:MAG: SGNH/GDSL hydrolase family protein [Nonomuraea sp.]|nr:SGNH/GDSL hydrolase family protein [Nonomuraea sp.]